MTNDRLALVKPFASWCGHFKLVIPEYIKAVDPLVEKEDIVLAEVDCTEDSICARSMRCKVTLLSSYSTEANLRTIAVRI